MTERDVPCSDIAAFGELIDDYQCAQIDGTHADRAAARIALMNAYRALLASSDARDAARYRCLRNCYSTDERMDVVDQLDEEMDSSLDAAIVREPK